MALNLGELLVRLGIDVSGFEKGISAADKEMAAVGKRFENIGNNLTRTVTLPLVGLGVVVSKAAIDFESAFAGVRKTVDATERQFAELEKGVRQMALKLPASTTEISKVAEAAGQLGVKREAILGFTETMVKLGTTTNMTSDEAATALARLANITQMPTEAFDRLGATVVALGNAGASTEKEIVDMALRLAGAGKTVGLAEHQILGFANALSSVGIEAEMGGSAISRVMVEIKNQVASTGDKLETFAKVAGMSAAEFQKAFEKDAAGALVTFIEGLGKMQQSGQNVFLVLEELGLSEIRVRDALLRASNAGDLFRQSLELGSKAWAENTALNKEAAERYKTVAAQLALLRNNVNDAAISLGQGLLPIMNSSLKGLQPFLDGLRDAAQRFADLDESTRTNIVQWALFAAAVGPAVKIITAATLNIAGLVNGLSKMTFAVKAVAAGAATWKEALLFLQGPVGWIITALGAMAVAIAAVALRNKQLRAEEEKRQQSLLALAGEYKQFTAAMDDATKSDAERTAAAQEQGRVIREIGEMFPELVREWDGHGQAVALDTERLDENTKAALRNKQAKNANSLSNLQEQAVKALNKVSDIEKQIAREEQALAEGLQRGMMAGLDPGAAAEQLGQGSLAIAQGYSAQLAEARREYEKANAEYVRGVTMLYGGLGDDDGMIGAPRGLITKQPTISKTPPPTTDPGLNPGEAGEEFKDAWERAFDEVMTAYSRTQEDMTENLRRSQQARLTLFENAQEKEKVEFERGQETKLTAFTRTLEDETSKFDNALEDRKAKFEQAQAKEKEIFERSQDDQLGKFKRRLEDELDAFRKTQEKKQDELKAQFEKSSDALDLDLKNLQIQEDKEEAARRQAQLQERVNKAQATLNVATRAGITKDITEAEKDLADARQDLRDWENDQARKAERQRLQDKKDALRKQYELDLDALKEKQSIELEAKKREQEDGLNAYQRQLEADKIAFEQLLVQAKVNNERELALDKEKHQRAQQDRLNAFKTELEDQQTQFNQRQEAAKTAYQTMLDNEMTAWKRGQEDRKTRYEAELAALRESFKNQLEAQAAFISNWNAAVERMRSKAPAEPSPPAAPPTQASTPSATVPPANAPVTPTTGGQKLDTIDAAKTLAKTGNLTDAAKILSDVFGMSINQAKENLRPLVPEGVQEFAKGGVVSRPTLGIFGEAGTEAVTPLSWLAEQIQQMGANMAAVFSARMADLAGIGPIRMPAMDAFMASQGRYGGGEATYADSEGGVLPLSVNVFIGNRQLEDVVAEAQEGNRRRGRG